jgi:hypothetical protein
MAMGCGVSRIVGDGMLPRMLLGSCTWRGCPCLSLPVASRAHSDRLCGDVTCRWRFTPICSERRHRTCVTVVARPLFTLEMLLVEMPVDMLAPI